MIELAPTRFLPHADVFLGQSPPNQVIVAGRAMTEHGAEFKIMVVARNDRRIAGA